MKSAVPLILLVLAAGFVLYWFVARGAPAHRQKTAVLGSPRSGVRGERSVPIDVNVLLERWRFPAAQVIGVAASGGAANLPSIHEEELTTSAPLARIWLFYAQKTGIAPWDMKRVPPITGTWQASGQGGAGSATSNSRFGVQTTAFFRSTASYTVSALVTHGEKEKGTYILVHVSEN